MAIRDQIYSSQLGNGQAASRFENHVLADNQFEYDPLEDADSIRLLLIQPAPRGDEDLQCSMIHTTLSTSFDFTALSYVWGTPSQTRDQRRTIWVDRKQVLIGPNLYDALLHLRGEEEPIPIWADAICINQLDFMERNHQVYIMRDIYSKAERTVIYLGADDGGHTLLAAWNFLERECNDRAPIAERPSTGEFGGDISDVEISVLSRPWFRRVWVFQEVIVSKRPLVQCGWRKTTWDSFCKVILLRPRLNDRYGWSLSNKPLFQYVVDMFLARGAFLRENGLGHLLPPWFDDVQDKIGKGSHILTTLSRARRLESSDSRDKIYAVLGVSSGIELNNDRIAIDYNKTVEQLYTDFAQYLIYSTQSYDVLSYVGRRQFPSNPATRWKSWVADWRVPLGPQRTILSILEQEDYEIQKRRQYQVRQNHCWTWNTLSSVGRVIGRIIAPIPQHIHLSGLDESNFQGIRDNFRGNEAAAERLILHQWRKYPVGFSWNYHRLREEKTEGPHLTEETHPNFRLNLPEKPPKLLDSRKETGWFFKRRKGKQTQPVSAQQQSQASHSKTATKLEDQKASWPPKRAGEPTIEEMLLLRSRTTVHWSGDISGAVSLVVDEFSVLEERSLANYTRTTSDSSSSSNTVDDTAVAIVPTNTRIGDMIIALKGSRLPFVVRRTGPFEIVDDPVLPLIYCELVGECFVNGYNKLDSVFVPGIAENGKEDYEFVFGEVYSENPPLMLEQSQSSDGSSFMDGAISWARPVLDLQPPSSLSLN